MSGDCQREMTLDEWVERLPEIHRARKEYAALKAEVEKFTSTNNARGAIAFLQQAVDTRIDDEWLKKVRAFLKQATAPVA